MSSDSPANSPAHPRRRGHLHELQATYRYLRLAIILLMLLLGFSVVLQIAADDGKVLPSVSAYYHSPARDVFVASLCAFGTCLIIHRGRSDTEDVLLNGAGYLSFFIAFVPTTPAHARGEAGAGLSEEFIVAATQNTWALLAAGLVGLIIEIVVLPQRERHRRSRRGRVVLVAGVLAYIALVAVFVLAREFFLTYAHAAAAILWFVCIVAIVGIHAIAATRSKAEQHSDEGRAWMNRYTLGFALIMLTLPLFAGPVRMAGVEHWLFLLEAVVLVEFLVFWVIQTAERWHVPTRRADELLPA